jgi:phosphoenolpyruvate synthase/pyruvate phosphate dikinase
MSKIEPLIKAIDARQFGGKAANLAKLLQNDIPVPSGIAVGLSAFNDDG